MKKLFLIPVFLLTSVLAFGQTCTDGSCIDKTCKITHVDSEKKVTYHQYIVQEFSETDFETKYMVQYAIVSDIITMPAGAMAVPFHTNDGAMYMIVSSKQYNTRNEAVAAGELAKTAHNAFCNYFVKPIKVSKTKLGTANLSIANPRKK